MGVMQKNGKEVVNNNNNIYISIYLFIYLNYLNPLTVASMTFA